MSVPPDHAGAILTVDLGAVVENWRSLCARATDCAAVVKADAYGLGAVEVTRALQQAGCRTFFVAHLHEALELRGIAAPGIRLAVLNGTPPGAEADFVASGILPIVNSLPQLAGWRDHAASIGRTLPVFLQLDSGMSRLGLAPADIEAIAADPALLEGLEIQLVMSHLACADEPDHPANDAQRAEFERLRALLPDAPASLANSSGIFLGRAFATGLSRPGAGLYGINPTPARPNPMRAVVSLEARIVQLRHVGAGAGIGYGHRARSTGPTRLATISIGYADGWPRNAALAAWHDGRRMPFAGTVSMDSIILDVTGASDTLAEGETVELIGPHQSVDDVAKAAGTIGYEILTRLGHRFHRRYIT